MLCRGKMKSLLCWLSKIYALSFLSETFLCSMDTLFNTGLSSSELLEMEWRRRRLIGVTVDTFSNNTPVGSQETRGLMYKGCVQCRTHFFTSTIRCIKSQMTGNVRCLTPTSGLTPFSTAVDSLATLTGDVGKLIMNKCLICPQTE